MAEGRAGQAEADSREIAKFDRMAARWWDPDGDMAPLHAMQPVRLDYVADRVALAHGRDRRELKPFAGLRILDIGCGGGLMSEPMAPLGAAVTGIDMAGAALEAARAHARQSGLDIEYRQATAGEVAAEIAGGAPGYDAVLAMEIVEHVPDPQAFVADAVGCLAPGAPIVMSTLNRTALSFALGIVAAEYVLGLLPRGTHDWRRFLRPDELAEAMEAAGASVDDRAGMVFDAVGRRWRLSRRNLAINYLVAGSAPVTVS